MNDRECEVCTRLVKEKYKHYKTWRNLAIVFMILTVVLSILYFGSGDVFVEETVEYNNEIEIENEGGFNTNANNGNIVVESKEDNDGIILASVILLVGGGLCGCYIVSKKKNNHK